jgi:hypothetical protein
MFVTSQVTSNTFNFAPSGAEFVLAAFGRIQVRPTELTPSHMFTARMALNLVLSEMSNEQPQLFEVELQTFPLTQGVATYAVPSPTVMILDLYLSTGTTTTTTNDRYLYPVSRTEYASYPNKLTQSVPTVYWYDRLISQTVTFYPVPDGNGPYTAKFYSVRQTQDADVINGKNVELPYRFYEMYTAGLAWKLAETYAPQLEDKALLKFERAKQIAYKNDQENVPMFISPQLGGYFDS